MPKYSFLLEKREFLRKIVTLLLQLVKILNTME